MAIPRSEAYRIRLRDGVIRSITRAADYQRFADTLKAIGINADAMLALAEYHTDAAAEYALILARASRIDAETDAAIEAIRETKRRMLEVINGRA
jgi:hypothetical protein